MSLKREVNYLSSSGGNDSRLNEMRGKVEGCLDLQYSLEKKKVISGEDREGDDF